MTPDAYTLVPIGYVQSPLRDPATAPKQGGEGAPAAWLVFNGAMRDGLRDLQVGDEVLVLTWLDRSHRDVRACGGRTRAVAYFAFHGSNPNPGPTLGFALREPP